MKSKTIKITLENLFEVLLSHGIQVQTVEEIMLHLGVPRSYVERALANIITIFPLKEASSNAEHLHSRIELATQLKEVKELIEKVYSKLSLLSQGSGPART
ncbi:MAG: hypothetical protein QW701_05075 [Candidatus Nezhaarchaeales archaeon]